MVQGKKNPDGTYLRPLALDEIDWPTEIIAHVGNHTQHAARFNFIIDALNIIRLCTPSELVVPSGSEGVDGVTGGVYLTPESVVAIDWPNEPLPHFPADVQHATRWNFLIDALNALRACAYDEDAVPEQGRANLDGSYLIPLTVAEYGYPCNPLPYFSNDVQHATLLNLIIDALNDVARCCPECCACEEYPGCENPEDQTSTDSYRRDSFAEWPLGQVDPSLWGDGTWFADDPPGLHALREAMSNPDRWGYIANYAEGGELDGEPEVPNISISCSTMNGVNVHTMKQTKCVGDTRSYYGPYAFFPYINPGVVPGNSDAGIGVNYLWNSMRFRFSDGFMFRDEGPEGQEFIWIMESEGTSHPDSTGYGSAPPGGTYTRTTYDAHFVTGRDEFATSGLFSSSPLTGGLEVFFWARTQHNGFGPSPEQFDRAEIITAAELMSGDPFRLVTRMFDDQSDPMAPGCRFQVWKAPAFGGALVEVYNHKFLYGTQFAPFNKANFTPLIVNELYSVPDSGSQCFEFTHAEFADGSVHTNPYGVPPGDL
jgi:hypothetical protein